MKVALHDEEIFSSVDLKNLFDYLVNKGWIPFDQIQNVSLKFYFKDVDGDEFEILFPINRNFRDYTLRIGDVINVLVIVENRSQIEIIKDIFSISSDVIRIRISANEISSGSIPLEKGIDFVKNGRDMMMAAACSTITPKAFFPSRKPNKAIEYINQIKMSQTEQGSFVLPILSPIIPKTSGQTSLLFEPYERQVTTTLAFALAKLRHIAEIAKEDKHLLENPDFLKDINEMVNIGISADLCESLFGLSKINEQFHPIEVNFSWASTISPPKDTPDKIFFIEDLMPFFLQFAEILREFQPRENFSLFGVVEKLERSKESIIGKVSILGFVDNEPHRVTFELQEKDYHRAVYAHDHQIAVYCIGTLIKEKNVFKILDVKKFWRAEKDLDEWS